MTLFPDRVPDSWPAPALISGPLVVTKGCGAAWATFSTDGLYRYILGRRWDRGPLFVVCLLNPSTATEDILDPTLRRVRGFALRDGYSGMLVVNVFAYRSTQRKNLCRVNNPVGPQNDAAIVAAANASDVIVVGWGVPQTKNIRERMEAVLSLFDRPVSIFGTLTNGGYPPHPLYLPSTTPIVKLGRERKLGR